jgi:hypothetical protein
MVLSGLKLDGLLLVSDPLHPPLLLRLTCIQLFKLLGQTVFILLEFNALFHVELRSKLQIFRNFFHALHVSGLRLDQHGCLQTQVALQLLNLFFVVYLH